MPIFLLMTKRLREVLGQAPEVSASRKIRAAAAVGLAAMAFVVPPPAGFKVADLAVGMASQGRFEAITGLVRPVLSQMFFVMFSAAMLGLAQLVYTHFMKGWEQKGLPVLPINALRPGAGGSMPGWSPGGTGFPGTQAQQPHQTGPLGSQQQPRPQAQPAQPARTGTIDEYKD